MPNNRELANEWLRRDASDACIDHVFWSNRPRVIVEQKLYGVRDYICRARRGDPASLKDVAYVRCGNPNCYNPEHIWWMPTGEAGALAQANGKRSTLAPRAVSDVSTTASPGATEA